MTVLDEALDPDERPVELNLERWEHIVDERTGHPELARYRTAIIRAVTAHDHVSPGRHPNESWFFLRDAGPSRWLQVVVAYEKDRGWITAFDRGRDP